jgi:hypothetical protein
MKIQVHQREIINVSSIHCSTRTSGYKDQMLDRVSDNASYDRKEKLLREFILENTVSSLFVLNDD